MYESIQKPVLDELRAAQDLIEGAIEEVTIMEEEKTRLPAMAQTRMARNAVEKALDILHGLKPEKLTP